MFNQKLILRSIVNELYEMMLNQNLTPCKGERFHRTSEHYCSEQRTAIEQGN